jgi:hypothetical protein
MAAALLGGAGSGCAVWPDRIVEPQFHNPFPQLHRVAVLPFYNQSAEPTLDGEVVALAYYIELQAIPGFEVMLVGVARQFLMASGIEARGATDFQQLARMMGVDAVVVGSITEYSPYYPPRMGLAVNWYAANPGFHPIPPGYGLPWGRAEEEFIPSPLVREAEFALAREQLKTQTPDVPAELLHGGKVAPAAQYPPAAELLPAPAQPPLAMPVPLPNGPLDVGGKDGALASAGPPQLPPEWPDPRGFIPPPPGIQRPILRAQHEPIITHTRIYHGQDAKFTERLATYYYLRDDARFGGWSGYLQRPDDFVRFCCHLHVTETLAARGGAGAARVLWRWPISRYER